VIYGLTHLILDRRHHYIVPTWKFSVGNATFCRWIPSLL
jgi:hypothetical protein